MKGKFIGRGGVCWLNQKRREEWALEIYTALIYGDYFNNKSLVYKCFKAKYFPRCTFLEATDVPNITYVWKSLLAA